MKKTKIALILNICIVVLEVSAMLWMMSGISKGVLTDTKINVFKYFTIDSNVLMGIAALIAAVEDGKVLKGKKAQPSVFSYIAALTGTVGVTLTMLVTVFFLAPTMGKVYGAWALFTNSNFLLHLLNPILSIVVFIGFERTDKILFRHTFTGIIPVILYGIYYTAVTVANMENGKIMPGYDWYGFFATGIQSAFIVLPIIVVITYGISVLLWRLNRKKTRNH